MPLCADLHYRSYHKDTGKFAFPVILLHGAGASLMAWPSSLRRLPAQPVFALDLPGHGHSKAPALRSMHRLVDRLHTFVIEMGFYHVVLVGYSLGAALAFSYACAHPQHTHALAAICCGGKLDVPPEWVSMMRVPARTREVVESFSRAAFHPKFPQSERRPLLAPMAEIETEVLRTDFLLGSRFGFQYQAASLPIPAILLGGSHDRIAPPVSLLRASRSFENASVHFIQDAGHMLIYEKTEEVRRLLSDFLSKTNPSF